MPLGPAVKPEIVPIVRSQAEIVVASIPLPYLALDASLIVQWASKMFFETFEVNPSETVGRRIDALGNGQWDIPELLVLLGDVLRERNEGFDNQIIEHDFEQIGVRSMSLTARRLEIDGKALILLGIEDVTERERALAAKRRYEAAIDATPDFIYIFGLDHLIKYANASLCKLWGVEPGEEAGKTFEQLGYEVWHADMHRREIDLVASTGKPYRSEIPFGGAAGIVRIYEYIFTPVFGPDGAIEAVAGTTRDVTDQRAQLEEIRKNDERQRAALDASLVVGTWDWDIIADLVHGDERLAQMWGFDVASLSNGIPIEQFVARMHPDDKDRVSAEIEQTMRLGGSFASHYRVADGSGTERRLSVRGFVQKSVDGTPIRFPGIAVDVTSEFEAAEKLKESEQRFRDMADSINQMIWVTRPDGFHEYYNRRWYEFTGVQSGSTDGEGWAWLFHIDDQPKAWAKWRRSLDTGEPYEVEYRLRRHDGVYRWVLGRAECVRDAEGNITKWYGTCTDIQDLTDAREEAQAANIAKSEFLANMSHEIRTPMNAIIGLANILGMSRPLSDRQVDYVKTLKMSADGLLALINDLLDISKIEARSVDLEEIPFSLTQVVNEVISMMQVRAQEKHLAFTMTGECIKEQTFIGDPARVRQIFTNLCSNAVKFTEAGSIDIAVECHATDDENIEMIEISVTDSGIGIAPDKITDIFEKFVQADSSISRRYGGTGLGLAITKMLAEVMGGRVEVKSELGKGSTFTAFIPLRLSQSKKASEPAAPLPGAQMHGHVLLVEDHTPNVMVATAFLDQFGMTWEVAHNGIEAVERIRSGKLDCVLMDVQMHGLNGLDATQLVREEEARTGRARVPIIGMTAHAMAGDRERCLGVGMDDYVSKPFDPDELRAKIARLIDARKAA